MVLPINTNILAQISLVIKILAKILGKSYVANRHIVFAGSSRLDWSIFFWKDKKDAWLASQLNFLQSAIEEINIQKVYICTRTMLSHTHVDQFVFFTVFEHCDFILSLNRPLDKKWNTCTSTPMSIKLIK